MESKIKILAFIASVDDPVFKKELNEKYDFIERIEKQGEFPPIYFKKIHPSISEIRNKYGEIIYLQTDESAQKNR